ncbi:MAG: hypothetical protein ACC618_01080 [Patescibacteria group bacterium]
MKNKALIGIAVVIVLAAAGFLLSPLSPFKKPSTETAPGTQTQTVTKDDATGEESFLGTVTDLLKLGKNFECNFDTTDEAGNVTRGTVYVASNRMRGRFNISQPDGTTLAGNTIQDGEYGYTWLEGQNLGTKLKLEKPEGDSVEKDSDTSTNFADDQIGYNCKAWRVDSSMFVPPSDVDFQDLSASIQQIEEVTQEVTDDQCAVCDQLPAGEPKTQCLQSLGCQ